MLSNRAGQCIRIASLGYFVAYIITPSVAIENLKTLEVANINPWHCVHIHNPWHPINIIINTYFSIADKVRNGLSHPWQWSDVHDSPGFYQERSGRFMRPGKNVQVHEESSVHEWSLRRKLSRSVLIFINVLGLRL